MSIDHPHHMILPAADATSQSPKQKLIKPAHVFSLALINPAQSNKIFKMTLPDGKTYTCHVMSEQPPKPIYLQFAAGQLLINSVPPPQIRITPGGFNEPSTHKSPKIHMIPAQQCKLVQRTSSLYDSDDPIDLTSAGPSQPPKVSTSGRATPPDDPNILTLDMTYEDDSTLELIQEALLAPDVQIVNEAIQSLRAYRYQTVGPEPDEPHRTNSPQN